MKYAIIDIGSNSVKMTVYEKGEKCFSLSNTAGLISYVKNGVLSDAGLTLLTEILERYKSAALTDLVEENNIHLFATASLRALSDPYLVIDEIYRRCKLKIVLLSGEKEAEMSLIGALCEKDTPPEGVLVDMGGGSFEVTHYQNGCAVSSHSFALGALSLFRAFVSEILPTKDEFSEIYSVVSRSLSANGPFANTKSYHVTVIGGSFKALALIYGKINGSVFDAEKSFTMKVSNIRKLAERLLDLNFDDRIMMISTIPDRIHTTLPALSALLAIADHFGCDEILLSPASARDGYYKKLLEGSEKETI